MNRKTIFTVAILIILTATIGVAKVVQQAHQPSIAWSSPAVYAGITSTTTVTKTLTFTSNQVLQGISLEAVPEIAKFVQIQPSTVSKLPAGQPQTVRLTFSAPAGAQFGAYDGTIHVRDGSRTLPQTLKTSITYAVVPLPPDPGEAGKATTAGIDSDGDGVRDDVERWIALSYPNSAKIRSALTQYSKAVQAPLLNPNDPELMMAVGRAQFCSNRTQYLLGIPVTTGYLYRAALVQLLNTYGRARAFSTADANSSGYFSSTPQPGHELETCDVDPNSLPN
jgi:hypothetical protein